MHGLCREKGRYEVVGMKYRKKPVTIDAYQTDVELDIPTLEGTMHANVGDYIITGVHGEQYPCKPDIFMETYEPAEGEQRNAELDFQIKDNWKLTAELMVSQQENEDLRKLCAELWETITEHNRVTFAQLLRFGERLVKMGVIE